jgi:hypothetical protein
MIVKFEGQTYEFPDDATDDEIAEALEAHIASSPKPAPTIAELEDALRNADAAGDTAAAQQLADEIMRQGANGAQSTAQPNAFDRVDDLPPGFSVVSKPGAASESEGLPAGFSVVSTPASPAGPPPSTAYDVAASFAAGVPRGIVETAMTPVTMGRLAEGGLDWLWDSGENAVRRLVGAEPIDQAARDELEKQRWSTQLDDLIFGAQDAVRNTMDENLYQPRTTAGEYAQTLGEFAAPGALPGRAARSAPTVASKAGRYIQDFAGNVVAPALLSEGAGQATENTVLETPARVLGAITGNAAVAANRSFNAPESVVRRATGDVTPQQWDDAITLQNNQTGVRLTGPEAIAQATGGASALPNVQRVVEGSVGGRARTAPFFAERPLQVDAAVGDVLDLIAPQAPNPFVLGPRAAEAADTAISGIRQKINDSTRPLYQAAEPQLIPDPQFVTLKADPSFAAALKRLRDDPELGPTYKALPDNSVGVVDAVTKDLFARGESLKNTANPLYGPERAMRSTAAAADARNAASRSSPEYAQALAEQDRLRDLILGPLEAGPVGRVAKTTDTIAAGNALLPQNPLSGSGRETAVGVKLLEQQDPTATRGLLRQNLADRYQRASTETQEGGREFAGAKFRKDVAGNAARREVLDAVLGALPDQRAAQAAPELLDVLQATGRRKPVGSATSFNNALQEELSGAQSLPGLARNIGLSLGTYVTKAGDAVQRVTMGRNIDTLADMFIDPRSVELIRESIARRPMAAFDDAARRSALQLGSATN